jgi:lysophospholipase L1-like esterase
VQDAISRELPQIKDLNPDFATILIGANDNFRETSVEKYRQDLRQLLDELQPMLTNPKNIVLITIPDYSKSPAGVQYGAGDEISRGIEEYNRVIKDEAEIRELKVADIFPLSQTMTGTEDFISDGLHPSDVGYAKWERVIFPVVSDLLTNL